MKPNSIKKKVACDIPNPSHRCSSPLIKYSSGTNKAWDTSAGISTKESTGVKGLYVTQFIKQIKVTKLITRNINIKFMIDQLQ